MQDPKSRQKSPSGHHPTTSLGYIFATKACIDNRKKNFLSSNISSTCPHNMVNFGTLVAEILSLVWGTPGNFNGFRFVAALLHVTLVVGVSQTLRRWAEGATYIWQGGHHVGHWPTCLVVCEPHTMWWAMMWSCCDWLTGLECWATARFCRVSWAGRRGTDETCRGWVCRSVSVHLSSLAADLMVLWRVII